LVHILPFPRGILNNFLVCIPFTYCVSRLVHNGLIITIVDSEYYNNIFKFEKLSKILCLPKPKKYNFNLKDYPDYEHTMSHQDASILDNYNKFTTYEFTL